MSDTAFIAQICLFRVRSEAAEDRNVSINIGTHLWIISLPLCAEHLAAPPSLLHLSPANSPSFACATDIRAHQPHFLRVLGEILGERSRDRAGAANMGPIPFFGR